MILGQKMEIQDLTNSKGLLPMKLGTAKIILGHNNLIHIVRLEQYQETIDRIRQTLENFEHVNEMKDSLSTTRKKLDELDHKLHTLLPNRRHKRGLINGLGTLIKSITGNMDSNDALHLNEQIEFLLNSDRNITNKINKQNRLNHEMIERFENITQHINNQQDVIVEHLNIVNEQIKNKVRTSEINLRYIQFFSQINYNIDLLYNHFCSISEAIIFAKLNIIPKQILSKEELIKINLEFKNQNVSIKSEQHMYELLGLQAYYNDTNVIFNILIPILSNETYQMIHNIPLPLEKNKIILTKPYLAMSPHKILYYEDRCPNLEGVYYCKKPTYEEKVDNSSCIGNLILNKQAHCEVHEKEEMAQIFQPEPNYIIMLNVPETLVTSSCGPNQTIIGSALIHFGNCDVEINNIFYKSTVNTYWDEVHIFPTILHQINTTPTYNHTIHATKLEDYKFTQKELDEILEPYVQQDDLHKPLAILVTLLVLMIVATYVLTYWGLRKLHTYKLDTPRESSSTSPAHDPGSIHFIWPSLNLKEGGVTSSTQSIP